MGYTNDVLLCFVGHRICLRGLVDLIGAPKMTCYFELREDGGMMFLCGDLGPHCANDKCAAVGTHLCDYPVGNERTCDMPICISHACEIAPGTHYCPGHLSLWLEFRNSGGLQAVLKNVVPFKTP